MKMTKYLLLLVCSQFLFIGLSQADPITDGAFSNKKVGWFPSAATSCDLVCRKRAFSTSEREQYYAPMINAKSAHVCKALIKTSNSNDPNSRGSGWLYGTNFPGARYQNYCLIATHIYGQVKMVKSFQCLCVNPRVIFGGDQPIQ